MQRDLLRPRGSFLRRDVASVEWEFVGDAKCHSVSRKKSVIMIVRVLLLLPIPPKIKGDFGIYWWFAMEVSLLVFLILVAPMNSRLTVDRVCSALLPTFYYFFRDELHLWGRAETVLIVGRSLLSANYRSAAPIMTEATTVAIVPTTMAIPADVSKDKSAPHSSIFGSSSSSEKTGRTLSLFTGRSGSGFDAGSIRAEEAVGAGSEEIYVPEWTVTKGFELNDGPARNLSLSSEVRMRAEYNFCEMRRWQGASRDVNPTPRSASYFPLKVQNQSLVNQVHELEISSADLREKLEMYEGLLKRLEEFQDNLMGPLMTRLAEIDVISPVWHALSYMRLRGLLFVRAIWKGMQEGLAQGIENRASWQMFDDLEAYVPSAEDDFLNYAIRASRDLYTFRYS
ncbi:hypothetical protein Tco_0161629 [Tanacetum coccineum]